MATHGDVALRFLIDEYGEARVKSLLVISNDSLRRWLRRGVPKKHASRIRDVWQQQHAHDNIESLIRDAQDCIASHIGHTPLVHVVLNRDGTIDGQLTVWDIPRGTPIRQVLEEMQGCADALQNLDGAFIQVAVRFAPPADRYDDIETADDYKKLRGLIEALTYWYTSDHYQALWTYAQDMSARIAGGQKVVIKGRLKWKAKTTNRKIETIIIRVHWNTEGRKPSR